MLLSRQTVTIEYTYRYNRSVAFVSLKQVICHSSLAILTLMGSVIRYTSGCIGTLHFSVPELSVYVQAILIGHWYFSVHFTHILYAK